MASNPEHKSLLATAAPPPRRLKSIAAAAALTHDVDCGGCNNDCVATRAEIKTLSVTPVSIIRLCTTAQGQAAQRQVLHDVQAPGRRQVQALLQVLREQRGLQRQLRPLHARGVMSRGDFPSRSASFIGCITGHKGKGDEYHRCKPHSETNED